MEEEKREMKNNSKSKGFQVQEVVILVIITCLFSFFAGTSFARIQNNPVVLEEPSLQMSEDLSDFIENYEYIINNYYEEVDEKTLLSAALKAVMKEMGDPYTVYMEEDEYSNLNLTLTGSYTGLGISIYKDEKTKYMVVSTVFQDSAAEKAGLEVGDVILSVDGLSTQEMETKDFSSEVLKDTKKSFELEILRGEEKKTIKVTKSGVVIPSVESKIYEKNGKKIGYIYISIFANNTAKQFEKELSSLEKKKIDSLIIDVRDNTGGHLSAVTDIISLFLDSTHIMYQTEQDGKVQKFHSRGDDTKKYPIVFLANHYSASASEVLIGSLKDNLQAKVIGETTYGKGTVQGMITLSSGDQYKVTTKKWLTPNGTWVNDTKGIAPDIPVTLEEKYYTNPTDENDNQLQKALEELSK